MDADVLRAARSSTDLPFLARSSRSRPGSTCATGRSTRCAPSSRRRRIAGSSRRTRRSTGSRCVTTSRTSSPAAIHAMSRSPSSTTRENMDYEHFVELRAPRSATTISTSSRRVRRRSTQPIDWFRWFVHDDALAGVPTLAGTLHHLDTAWRRRSDPNIVLCHYADFTADPVAELLRSRPRSTSRSPRHVRRPSRPRPASIGCASTPRTSHRRRRRAIGRTRCVLPGGRLRGVARGSNPETPRSTTQGSPHSRRPNSPRGRTSGDTAPASTRPRATTRGDRARPACPTRYAARPKPWVRGRALAGRTPGDGRRAGAGVGHPRGRGPTGGSGGYVADAVTTDGTATILKIAIPDGLQGQSPFAARCRRCGSARAGAMCASCKPTRPGARCCRNGSGDRSPRSTPRRGTDRHHRGHVATRVATGAGRRAVAHRCRAGGAGCASTCGRVGKTSAGRARNEPSRAAQKFAAARHEAFDATTAVLIHGDAHPPTCSRTRTNRDRSSSSIPTGCDPSPRTTSRSRSATGPPNCSRAIPSRSASRGAHGSAPGRRDPRAIWEWAFLERVSTGLFMLSLHDPAGAQLLAVADQWAAV